MKFPSLLAFIALFVASSGLAQNAPSPRETLSLDSGWSFNLGDIAFPVIKGHGNSYFNAKAGKAWGAAAPEYDDSSWRILNLPHDWVVEGPFDQNANLSQGYRPRGIGWYRRQFKLPVTDRGRHLELQFDGIATHATVWFNGTVVHRNWCGYTSAYIDITPFANYGDGVNTIAIRVDADAMEGWWYEGGGIYRHTWLVKRDALHLVTDGVYANPIRKSDGSWTIPVEATLNNAGKTAATADIESILLDPAGKIVAQGRAMANVDVLADAVAKFSFAVPSPRLWSVDDPVLYTVRTVVKRDGRIVDETTTPAGFRTLRFDADKGFFLNDRPLKLQGVCNHQDHAGVGVAVPDSIWDFRVRRLKEMGANAYRCAHNPPAKEFLQACDRLGLLVMDENRNFNASPEYVRQLEWMVRRDRNHPSVILWSVFNEEPMQGSEQGYEMVRRMAAVVKRLDTNRPVTAAMNGGLFSAVNVSQAVDVVGFNYQQNSYDKFHAANPALPLTSSEDTSAFMTRGEYATDRSRRIIDSYDTQRAPWGSTRRDAWKAIADRPFVAGGFDWTGFDYRGEPTPNDWPAVSSYFGAMDICGFPKAAYYIHQAQWLSRPVLQLVPHWNWPDRAGKNVKVMAITNADTVALALNGKVIGEKPVDKWTTTWEVPYTPGKLEAIAKKNGLTVARFAVQTTGEPVALRLIPDRIAITGDGWDALPVTIEALDAEGRPVPTAHPSVEFELTGAGVIIGHGNGDPTCHDPEKGNRRSLFNGLAQVIIQSTSGASGQLVLRAKADGLKTAEVTIEVNAVPVRPFVATLTKPPIQLDKWRQSPVTAVRPDPNQRIADNDMNSWAPVQPGKIQPFTEGNWAIFRTAFTPREEVRQGGGKLVFKAIAGRAEVWVDGKLLGKKETPASAPFTVSLPPAAGERSLSVLIEAEPGQAAGLAGVVTAEK